MEIENELVNSGIEIARREGVEHVEFRDVSNRNNGLQCKTEKVSLMLNLPDTSDELWKSFDSKLRSQIKRPLKEERA